MAYVKYGLRMFDFLRSKIILNVVKKVTLLYNAMIPEVYDNHTFFFRISPVFFYDMSFNAELFHQLNEDMTPKITLKVQPFWNITATTLESLKYKR